MAFTLDFTGQTALVTGASSGIGRAVACALAASGASVAVNYNQSESEAREVVESIGQSGGQAFLVKADVSKSDEVQAMADQVLDQFDNRLDILINNAGSLIRRSTIAECPVELWDEIIAVNLRSVFLVSNAFLPNMIERQSGCIVNVASIAGRNGGGGGSVPYGSAKGGVIALTFGLAQEVAKYGIRVNGVNPGVIDTRFHQRFTPQQRLEQLANMIPLHRLGTAEECAQVVLFLASPAASYITGEVIEVNGGQLVH
jgi:3-oxoacyl-[acyl-carrier protein] reductase